MAIPSSDRLTPHVDGGARDTIEAVIVGAGVSGLLAAHELLRRRPGSRVILVDAGLPLEQRRAQPTPPMGGEGGAGLFLGGRLYLGAASLPVMPPVSAPESMRPVIAGEEYVRRAQEMDALLHALGARAEWQPEPPEALARAIHAAADAGVDYITSYPSRRLSPEDKTAALTGLRARLIAQGARFIFGARVTVATPTDEGFLLTLDSSDAPEGAPPVPERLTTRTLLLAPGRYGAEWLTRVVSDLGAEVVALPRAFGVRIETPATVYDPLTDVNPDPRLQMALAEDAYIKTYATCPGGVVSPVARYGALVASGVPMMRREDRGPSTTVAILAQPGVTGAAGAWRGGERAARALNQRAPGRLTVQRLEDVRQRRATTAEALASEPDPPDRRQRRAGRAARCLPRRLLGRVRGLPRTDRASGAGHLLRRNAALRPRRGALLALPHRWPHADHHARPLRRRRWPRPEPGHHPGQRRGPAGGRGPGGGAGAKGERRPDHRSSGRGGIH